MLGVLMLRPRGIIGNRELTLPRWRRGVSGSESS
jgi:hypothetical protein